MGIRIRRLFAFLIDWNIILFPFFFIFAFAADFINRQSEAHPIVSLLGLLLLFLPLIMFILRDVIFKGRSLGKRIFGLYVYDKNSLEKASAKKCFLRNIFLIIFQIDGIILLATGKTAGDRVAGTLVMTKKAHESYINDATLVQPISKKQKAKKALKVFVIIIACVIAFIGFIQIILNLQKDSEEYKIAYSYFTGSKAFNDLNVDESKIRFNQYSYNREMTDNSSLTETAYLGFTVNFKSFVVVCHKENGIWTVCDECTMFE